MRGSAGFELPVIEKVCAPNTILILHFSESHNSKASPWKLDKVNVFNCKGPRASRHLRSLETRVRDAEKKRYCEGGGAEFSKGRRPWDSPAERHRTREE